MQTTRFFVVSFSALAIAGCNDGGPTAKDIEAILPGAQINLQSCAKVNDATYRCRFTIANPKGVMDQGEQSYCFGTDGTKWEMKLFGC